MDASIAVAWSFEDERRPPIDDVLSLVQARGGVVPVIWLIETANTFRTALRKGRITAERRNQLLVQLRTLPITIETHARETIVETVATSDRFDITVYDAAYLEIAIRRRLPLATLDKQLAAAAHSAGVEVLP